MNLFSRVLGRFGLSGLINPTKGQQDTGGRARSTDAGVVVGDDRALQLSTAWACVDIITNSVASLKMDWYRKTDDGERELLEIEHPISRLFLGRPNKYMKGRDFKKALVMQLALYNNAYALIDWSPNGKRPIAMTPLHPGRVQVYRTPEGVTYIYKTDAGDMAYSDKSILHLKGISLEGVAALNRLDFMRPTLGLGVAAQVYASKQFANGGNPSGVLKVDEFLSEEQRAAMRPLYEGVTEGAINANKIWILEGGLDYQSLTELPDKMQMIQSQEFNAAEIARFFGVPSVLVGASGGKSSAWPAAFEQQVLSFLTFTLQAYVDEVEDGLKDALVDITEALSIFPEHDESDFIRMDSAAKANFLSRLVQNGLATRNEARKRLKLPKSDEQGADKLTVQTNLSEIENLDSVQPKAGVTNNVSENQ